MLSWLSKNNCQQVSIMTLSLIVPNKRVSFFSSFSPNNTDESGKDFFLGRLRASLTVEATMVVPLFLFFMMTLLYLLEIVRMQSNCWEQLHCQVTEQCFAAYETVYKEADMAERRYDDGNIFIKNSYVIKPFIGFWPINGQIVEERCFGHGFVGYIPGNLQQSEHKEDQYVYITPSGKKYHFSEDCTYLKVVLRATGSVEISGLRNASGEIYYPCDFCHSADGGLVYFTTWGNRYHGKSDCSALKRTVLIIPLSQVGERSACSKCG